MFNLKWRNGVFKYQDFLFYFIFVHFTRKMKQSFYTLLYTNEQNLNVTLGHEASTFIILIQNMKKLFFNLSFLSVLLFKDIYLVASDISFTSPLFQHCYSKVYCISRNLIFSLPFSHHSYLMAYNIWYQNTLFSPFLSFYLFPRHQLFARHIAAHLPTKAKVTVG